MAEMWPLTADSGDADTASYIDNFDVAIEMDVDEIVAVIRRHLVWPPPIQDKALLEDE